MSVVLIDAIIDGNTNEALAMISRGQGLQERDKYQRTPLHVACDNGHTEVAMALMERGADIHARDNNQNTPLHEACDMGHTEVAMALIERGADIDARDKVSPPSPLFSLLFLLCFSSLVSRFLRFFSLSHNSLALSRSNCFPISFSYLLLIDTY